MSLNPLKWKKPLLNSSQNKLIHPKFSAGFSRRFFMYKVIVITTNTCICFEKGITQYKMAKDTGMSKSSILYIENFTQRPSLYTIIMLADYLGLDFSEVLKKVSHTNR